uniref:Uncharacterized protein n=2 Tax=Bodo saltans TaxID=75058 RepID=A0A0S4J1T1_BODSA|nr:Hypothetical protein, putative [Bodo saltans]|eukprot:CUG82831.1 Hypothetical protein, putative [Bodo saltans]
MRRALSMNIVKQRRKIRATSLQNLLYDAARIESAVRIQCSARRWLARRRALSRRLQRDHAAESLRVIDARPELFSIADLPKSLFDWDALLREERRFVHCGPLSTQVDPDLFYQRRQLLALYDSGAGAGGSMLYPHPASQSFLHRALDIFRLIDVRERGVVEERFLIEIHEMFGGPVPRGVEGRGGVEEDVHRPQYARSLLVNILQHSGRLDSLRVSSDGTLVPIESIPRGSLNANADEFCTFLSILAQQ